MPNTFKSMEVLPLCIYTELEYNAVSPLVYLLIETWDVEEWLWRLRLPGDIFCS